jgi:hypothetical protein
MDKQPRRIKEEFIAPLVDAFLSSGSPKESENLQKFVRGEAIDPEQEQKYKNFIAGYTQKQPEQPQQIKPNQISRAPAAIPSEQPDTEGLSDLEIRTGKEYYGPRANEYYKFVKLMKMLDKKK